jgi:hypothetical protein
VDKAWAEFSIFEEAVLASSAPPRLVAKQASLKLKIRPNKMLSFSPAFEANYLVA